MRVLILTPEYLGSGGGIITFYRNLCPALVRAGLEVHVLEGSGVHSAPSSTKHVLEGVHISVLERARVEDRIGRFYKLGVAPLLQRHLAAATAMWEQASEELSPDLVEACDWGLSFVPAAHANAVPVVAQMHGSIGQIDRFDPTVGQEASGILTRLIETVSLQRCFEVQSPSRANAKFWKRRTGLGTVDVLPAFHSAQTTVGREQISSAGLVLGRVQTWKGAHVLCEAVQLLAGRAPQINWVGRDTSLGHLRQSYSAFLAKEFPSIWGSIIRHHPQVTFARATQLQRSARFIVVPSTWDVFNFTCVEAMASGRPVICSTSAGASELIENGVNGFVYDNEAASLAAAIDHVSSLPESRIEEIGAAARATIAHKLDPERVADLRIARYQRAVTHFQPKSARGEDDWLYELTHGAEGGGSQLAFLDHLPLRSLLRYTGARLASKVSGGRFG